jgi:predicted DNA binding CopG/RHH family protein
MIRINVYVTQKELAALRKLADDTGLPFSEHIRRALDEYLAKKVKGYGARAGNEGTGKG